MLVLYALIVGLLLSGCTAPPPAPPKPMIVPDPPPPRTIGHKPLRHYVVTRKPPPVLVSSGSIVDQMTDADKEKLFREYEEWHMKRLLQGSNGKVIDPTE